MVVVVGVMDPHEEEDEEGEVGEVGDHALGSKNQRVWSIVRKEDGGAAKDCKVLTLS